MRMTDQSPVPRGGDNSPEYVAMRMAEIILIYIENGSWNQITREEYLDTYAQCLDAVRGGRSSPAAPRHGHFAAAG